MFLNISPNKEKCISSEEEKVQEEQGKALWRWAARSSNRRVWWRTVKSPFQPLDKKYILYLPIFYVFTGAAGRISYKEEKRKCHSALHPSCLIPSLSLPSLISRADTKVVDKGIGSTKRVSYKELWSLLYIVNYAGHPSLYYVYGCGAQCSTLADALYTTLVWFRLMEAVEADVCVCTIQETGN